MTFLAKKWQQKDFFLIVEKKRVGVSFLLERLFDQSRADLPQINMRQIILYATLADKALLQIPSHDDCAISQSNTALRA